MRFAAKAVIVTLAVAELSGYAALSALQGWLHEDIQRRAAIYQDQTERIAAFLASAATRREVLDPVLGWRYRAGYRSARETINAQGLRASRTYPARPGSDVLRVGAFGDSFVYCSEVTNEESWPVVMERLFPRFEVLNYGVGGYGIDQAYLRYRAEGGDLAPHVVLMGFVADDLGRVVNVYRRFISTTESPLFKPRFVLSPSGDLQLVATRVPNLAAYTRYLEQPHAIREIGGLDHWYEPLIYENALYDWSALVRLASTAWIRVRRRYLDEDRLVRNGQFNEASTAFAIQLKLFQQFASDVRQSGATPAIVFFPDRSSLRQSLAGWAPVYRPLAIATSRSGIPTVDLADAFVRAAERHGIETVFTLGGHYSPAGNELVARSLAVALPR